MVFEPCAKPFRSYVQTVLLLSTVLELNTIDLGARTKVMSPMWEDLGRELWPVNFWLSAQIFKSSVACSPNQDLLNSSQGGDGGQIFETPSVSKK